MYPTTSLPKMYFIGRKNRSMVNVQCLTPSGWTIGVLALLLLVLATTATLAQDYTVTPIRVPEGPANFTLPTGLSQDGWVVGNVGNKPWLWRPDVPNGTTGTVTVFDLLGFERLRAESVSNGNIALWGFTRDGNGNPYTFPFIW